MTAQTLRDKIERMTTEELQAKITRYESAISKTDDSKERSVIISVIDKYKNILDERTMNTEDGSHKPVKIWKQIWTGQNLNVSHFRNGDIIPEAKTAKEWEIAGKNGKPAWCYYDNDPAIGKIYGKLYNWYAVIDLRTIAPAGWHLPTSAEWATLIGDRGYENTVGGELKESGTTHWQDPNLWATDIHGFRALPGGHREDPNSFFNIGRIGIWWTASECHPYRAWSSKIYSIYGALIPSEGMKSSGYSVRCVKD
jgi:uncharacterized protein (TIGR02145 family)